MSTTHGFKKNSSFRQDMLDPLVRAAGMPEPDKPLFEPLKSGKVGIIGGSGPTFKDAPPDEFPPPPPSISGRLGAADGSGSGRLGEAAGRGASPIQESGSPPNTGKLPALTSGRLGATRNSSTGGLTSGGMSSNTFAPPPVVPSVEPVVPNHHFTQPAHQPLLPWEMAYSDRRAISHDPRIVKQVQDEKQWEATAVRGVWARIRGFCHPHFDWMMTAETMQPLLLDCGIVSPTLTEKLFKLFDIKKEGKFSGLIACKLIEIGLTHDDFREGFVRHCFDRFDKTPGNPRISKAQFRQTKLLDPNAGNGKKKGSKGKGGSGGNSGSASARGGGGKGKSAVPLTTTKGATFAMVQGFLQIFDQATIGNTAVPTEDDRYVNYAEFAHQFLDPWRAEWVGAFLGPLLEACAQYFAPPLGVLPYISVRWLKSTIPVTTNTEDLYDADSLLLQELERTGGVDELASKKKKKKGKSDKK